MAEAEHMIERRADLLAQKMQRRVQVLSQFLKPDGQRPPFTKQLNNEDAMRFWMQHRYDEIGAQVLQNLQPHDIAELDAALAQHHEDNFMPSPGARGPMGG